VKSERFYSQIKRRKETTHGSLERAPTQEIKVGQEKKGHKTLLGHGRSFRGSCKQNQKNESNSAGKVVRSSKYEIATQMERKKNEDLVIRLWEGSWGI